MAFKINTFIAGSSCDICQAPGSEPRPIFGLEITSRDRYERQYIAGHRDCLERQIAKAQKAYDKWLAQEKATLAAAGVK